MKVELQISSVMVLAQDLLGAGGSSFMIPSGSLIVPQRKSVKRKKKKKGSTKVATVIQNLIDEIR